MQLKKRTPMWLSLSLAILTLSSAQNVFAQTDSTPSASDEKEAEKKDTLGTVVVTGSRIPRIGFVTPTPVTSISKEDIRASGAVTIGDLLNDSPQLGSTFSLGNSARFIGTVGLNLLDLRRLGTDRTLVLVNGRRHVGASSGSTSVDVNTIPVEWIERVDIITGGASAVYGADAVSGVVNFILKESFEGFEVRAQTGKADDSNFTRSFGSMTAGSDFADSRGSIGISLEVSNQSLLDRTDREATRTQYTGIGIPGGPSSNVLLTPNGGGYALSSAGNFTVAGRRYIFDNGNFRLQRLGGDVAGTPTRDDVRQRCAGPNCDYLDTGAVALLQPDSDRFSFNTAANFQLNDAHKAYFEGKYVKTENQSFGQPAFDNGARAVRIFKDNAYLPTELVSLMTANNLSFITVSRFNVDAGRRGEEVTRETARGVMGITGDFADVWTYDASFNYGALTESRANVNNRINARYYASIDAVRNPAGQIVCRATIDPLATIPTNLSNATRVPVPDFARTGCVPTSILGNGAINPAAAAFFNARSLSATDITQLVGSASVTTSELAEWYAGYIGFSAGIEHRKETSSQKTDALSAAGLTFLNAIPNQNGEYDVNEAFAEFSVPVLTDAPFAQSVIVDAALRYADYNTVGGTLSNKLGIDWTFNDQLRARATYAKALRAPNIGELFDPQIENFFAINDPCSAQNLGNAPNVELRRANCTTVAGAGFVSRDTATRRGVSGGNPNLKEETGKTYTLGFVYNPSFVDSLSLSVDYWNIEITDVIGSVSGQQTADRCVDGANTNNEFCRSLTRDPVTREIIFVQAVTQNLQKREAQGIDLEVGYKFDLYDRPFTTRFISTYLRRNRLFAFQNEPGVLEENRGVLGDPKWLANLSLGYQVADFNLSWETRYVGDQKRVSTESFRSNPLQQDPIFTGDALYTDLQVKWIPSAEYSVYLGIDNAFNQPLPVALFGDGGGSAIFENLGRQYYLGATYKF